MAKIASTQNKKINGFSRLFIWPKFLKRQFYEINCLNFNHLAAWTGYPLEQTLVMTRPNVRRAPTGTSATRQLLKPRFFFWGGKRLFRPLRAIAEPWDEGDGKEWAKMAVDRVTWQWLCGMPTPVLCRGRFPSHSRPPLPGGGSRTATYPVAVSHQARVNEGRTEERGPVNQRISRDLEVAVSTDRLCCRVPPITIQDVCDVIGGQPTTRGLRGPAGRG